MGPPGCSAPGALPETKAALPKSKNVRLKGFEGFQFVENSELRSKWSWVILFSKFVLRTGFQATVNDVLAILQTINLVPTWGFDHKRTPTEIFPTVI